MLQDVGDAGVIGRIRLEADGEDIVGVITRDMQVVGAGLVMLQLQCRQLQLRDVLCSDESESMELRARFRIQGEIRHGLTSRVGSVAQHDGCL